VSWSVEVYSGTNPWAPAGLIDTLSEDDARSVRIVENDPGTWTLTVPRDSADAALLTTYRWVKFRKGGNVVRSGRIQPWEQSTIDQGEEATESLTVSGQGCIGTLRDIIVFPHESTGRLARDSRWFNFASPDLDDSAWGAAVQLYQQGDAGTSLYGVDVPENWPDSTAWWIWGTAINLMASPPHAVGDCYFRTTVTLVAEGDYSFFITADDGYELWVDGVMLAAQTEAFIYRQTFRVDQFLDAGTHTIAIKAINMNRPSSPSTNAAGLLFALYSTTSGGELAVLQKHSDNTWLCEAYPATPPGFTPGAILDILFQEGYDRGRIAAWSWSFTHSLDSNGDPWPEELEISFRYEDTLVDVLAKLAETFIDYAPDEDFIELDVIAKGGWTSSSGVSLLEGTHLSDLQHNGDPTRVTDLLMRSAEGRLTEVSSGNGTPNSSADPQIEGFLEAGSAGSDEAAAAMADGVFNNAGANRVRVTAALEDIVGAVPLVDFGVQQYVDMPDRDGVAAATYITAVTITDVSPDADGEEDGSVAYALEGWQVP
jgi:hypothetical protein